MVNYTENIIPAMTSDNMNGFIITASSNSGASYLPFRAFDRNLSYYWAVSTSATTGWIACEFPTPKRIVKFTIRNRLDYSSPKAFTFEGFDGTNWIVLFSSPANETPNWRDGEKREFLVNNDKEYKRYRVNVSQAQSAGRTIEINEIEMMEELILEKYILNSNNKYYSFKPIRAVHETNMTSNTTPPPLIASASTEFNNNYAAWKAFNGTNSGGVDYWCTTVGTTGWVQINYGRRVYANSVELTAHLNSATVVTGMPKDFNILGSNDGINFTELLKVTNQVGWGFAETREFNFNITEPYQYYRIQVLSENGYGYVTISEILFRYKSNSILELPNVTKNNFVKYGSDTINNLNTAFIGKDYLLQKTNSGTLIEKQLNKKPLSISFK